MTNDSMNQALRTLAGVSQPPAAAAPVPTVAKGNAGNGCAPTAAGMPAAPSMNQWLQAAARGRAKAEVITITGGAK